MLKVAAELVDAAPVAFPGKVKGLATDRVVEPPRDGFAVEDTIWFVVPAIPMLELANAAFGTEP
jgi:hypothetical protein